VVAKLEGPQFSGGANIAIKCPSHTYEQTVAFYRDTLGLPLIEEEKDGCIFQFGPNRLWIDSVPNLSHPDVWLELETNDTEALPHFLKIHGVSRRDEVEQLREDFNGFFISAPNGVIIWCRTRGSITGRATSKQGSLLSRRRSQIVMLTERNISDLRLQRTSARNQFRVLRFDQHVQGLCFATYHALAAPASDPRAPTVKS
jgi:catechol 2,3-dioxygenase-like lactoylglutathione lyase family enzyme